MPENKLSNDVVEIEDLIYEVRGVQVMLDSDLARLYNCKNGTKEVNQAVKNNPEKFPERFSWCLNDYESKNLLVKIFDQKNVVDTRGGKYKNPRVFTEQGVVMLATILKSKEATYTSIKIIDAFVAMRKYISSNLIEQRYINELVLDDHKRINLLETTFNKLNEKQKVNTIFYKGEIFDAYYLLMERLSEAKKEIIIIDDYAGRQLFKIIKDIKVPIKIITNNINEIDKKKYKSQYNNIEIIKSDYFHDRFIIIDNKKLYHSGASFKDLGVKCFGISEIEDENIIANILNIIKKI